MPSGQAHAYSKTARPTAAKPATRPFASRLDAAPVKVAGVAIVVVDAPATPVGGGRTPAAEVVAATGGAGGGVAAGGGGATTTDVCGGGAPYGGGDAPYGDDGGAVPFTTGTWAAFAMYCSMVLGEVKFWLMTIAMPF